MQHGKPTDPYRLIFPLGIILGVIGVSIWPLYYFGVTEGYSGRAHAFVQSDGFLYAFIAGFLLTAIPRFTRTDAPSRKTQYAVAVLLVVAVVSFEVYAFPIGDAAFVVAHFTLITLAARRFLHRHQNPTVTFALVGIGLISGAIGAVITALIDWDIIAPFWYLLGKRLLSEGMALLLVLGVGGFLGPRLLGFAELPELISPTALTQERIRPTLLVNKSTIPYMAAGLAVFFSLIAEYGFELPWVAFVRAVVATVVILTTVQLWRLPVVRTTLSWCVWIAHWLVVVAVWMAAFAPRYRVDFLHVLFIGGFSLLILAVATRVTLSHGGHGLEQERGL